MPWNLRSDEPDTAYKRFMIYRNLGPGRTLTAAAQQATKGNKKTYLANGAGSQPGTNG